MNRERWDEVKDLFALALERPPQQRAEWLAERCAGDEELRREVESLLANHDDELLERPVKSDRRLDDWLPPEEVIAAGTRVGAYEIVRELGRGGMGAVYLAARADREFQKRVAIKVIRRDMLTPLAVRRFRNERQILATLEHPNIARLIDGGTTTDGVPYFVMEYVEGEPLLQYCDAHAVVLRQRLELYLKVCDAVHHAHRRLIVHRDLKPSNILVDRSRRAETAGFRHRQAARSGERGNRRRYDADRNAGYDAGLRQPGATARRGCRCPQRYLFVGYYSPGISYWTPAAGRGADRGRDGPSRYGVSRDGDLARIASRAIH